jgi:hypothetical protein
MQAAANLKPYVFRVSEAMPHLDLEAGQFVIVDLSNLEIPIAAVRPMSLGFDQVVAMARAGTFQDVNGDQPLAFLSPLAAERAAPPRRVVGQTDLTLIRRARGGRRAGRSHPHLRLLK